MSVTKSSFHSSMMGDVHDGGEKIQSPVSFSPLLFIFIKTLFSKSVKSGVHLQRSGSTEERPAAVGGDVGGPPQKSAADPFKAETLRIARRRRRRHRHPSNYPSHFLRLRARCFSRRLSVPGRWISLVNLPLIRHQRESALIVSSTAALLRRRRRKVFAERPGARPRRGGN